MKRIILFFSDDNINYYLLDIKKILELFVQDSEINPDIHLEAVLVESKRSLNLLKSLSLSFQIFDTQLLFEQYISSKYSLEPCPALYRPSKLTVKNQKIRGFVNRSHNIITYSKALQFFLKKSKVDIVWYGYNSFMRSNTSLLVHEACLLQNIAFAHISDAPFKGHHLVYDNPYFQMNKILLNDINR